MARTLLLVLLAASYGGDESTPWPGCAKHPDRADACFSVHGRLALGNGNPGRRIWVVGTHRMLGVFPDDPAPVEPECLADRIAPGGGSTPTFWCVPSPRNGPV
ncbi:MAG TPA: hypothetical protein VMR86_01070 [Myxococcota bacterium]|nr:hypothetical protein [Myxococcota bacterium]